MGVLAPGDRRTKPGQPQRGPQAGARPGPRVSGRRQAARRVTRPVSLQHLLAQDPETSIRWQVVDKRIPLYASHKAILQKVATLFGAYY